MFRSTPSRIAALVGLGVLVTALVLSLRPDDQVGAPLAAADVEPAAPLSTPTTAGGSVAFAAAPLAAPAEAPVASRPAPAFPAAGPSEVDVGEEHEGARTIRGVVLDARGAPAEGARVVLRRLASDAAAAPPDPAAIAPAAAWEATADGDGAFVFRRAPALHMALDARGRDGDQASLFVDAGWSVSLDVTLVLEATATVRVASTQLAGASVRLQPLESRARGWSGALDPPPEDAEDTEDPGAGIAAAEGEEGEPREPAEDVGMPSHDAMMTSVLHALEAPLLEWDPDAPEASLVRLAEGALTAVPPQLLEGFDAELRRELDLPEGTSRRVLLDAAIAKALEEEPAIARIVGLVAARFAAAPDRGLEALIQDEEFEKEMREAIQAEEVAKRDAEAEIYLEDATEPASVEAVPADVEAEGLDAAEAPPFELEPSPVEVEQAALAERYPELAGLLRYRSWGTHEEATGTVGEALTVRAGYTYEVIVDVGAEFWEVDCGRVFVGAGEDVVVRCSSGSVVVTGRLVDAAGRPAPGEAFIEAWAEGVPDGSLPACDAEVAANGSFRCTFQLSAATAARIQLRRDLPDAVASVSRRGVTLVPGAAVDLGTLVLRGYQGDDAVQFDGAELVDADDGVVFAAVDPGAPAAALGLQAGDALVRIGRVEAGRLPAADLFDGLAGGPEGLDVDPGDDVLIRDARGATFSLPLGALMTALGGL